MSLLILPLRINPQGCSFLSGIKGVFIILIFESNTQDLKVSVIQNILTFYVSDDKMPQ